MALNHNELAERRKLVLQAILVQQSKATKLKAIEALAEICGTAAWAADVLRMESFSAEDIAEFTNSRPPAGERGGEG